MAKVKPEEGYKYGMSWAKSLGKPIEDATEPLEVRLSARDVKEGEAYDSLNCAFSRGICRQEYAAQAWVGLSIAFVEWADKILRYEVPETVSREIVSFDRHHLAEIGEFHLRPPAPTNALGAGRGSSNTGKGKRRRFSGTHLTANVRHR